VRGPGFTAPGPFQLKEKNYGRRAKWDAVLISAVGIGVIFVVLGILLMSGVFDTAALNIQPDHA
jgi:hypothetical protein